MRKRRHRIKIEKPMLTTARMTEHKGQPAFILAADDHVRSEAPACRLDLYEETLFKKLEFRNKIALKYDIPILNAGDLGEKSYFVKEGIGWSAGLYNRYSSIIKDIKMLCVAGNHDLPGHDIENLSESAIGGLIDSNVVELLNESPMRIKKCNIYGCSWDCEIPAPELGDGKNILVIHKMIINQLPLWPGQEAPKAIDILMQNPGYDLIVSGDNHNTFVAEYNNRLLVNAGSMMRSTTKQFDHKPCMFLYYPESNSVEKIFYPIEDPEKVISKKHIEKKNQKQEVNEKYTNLVNKANLNDLLTFKENSEIFISKSMLTDNVKKLIRRFVNHENPENFN